MAAAPRCLMLAAALLAPFPAATAPTLLATGTLTGSAAGVNADLSGLPGTLENGVSANVLGGIGSGIAWAGSNTFVAVPDRGPNAAAYNPAINETTSFISRMHTLSMALTPSTGPTPFTVTPTLTATTLLWSPTPLSYGSGTGLGTEAGGGALRPGAPAHNTASRFYFTGRSDNFGPGNSGDPTHGRLDPEGIRVSRDGRSVFVADEYGPHVYQFDRATGERIRSFALPSSGPGNLVASTLSPVGATEVSGNTTGRQANRGMEGLAITPDGQTLVGLMQSALRQDIAAEPNLARLVAIDIATGVTREYAYLLTTGGGISEITAINDHEFLVDERDGRGLGDGNAARIKHLFRIDIAAAADITGLDASAAAARAVSKSASPVVDLVAMLGAAGVPATRVPSKIEGLAFGEDVTVTVNGVVQTLHTLWVVNDNDFVPDIAGPNLFYVLGLTDADLAAMFQAQAFDTPALKPERP